MGHEHVEPTTNGCSGISVARTIEKLQRRAAALLVDTTIATCLPLRAFDGQVKLEGDNKNPVSLHSRPRVLMRKV